MYGKGRCGERLSIVQDIATPLKSEKEPGYEEERGTFRRSVSRATRQRDTSVPFASDRCGGAIRKCPSEKLHSDEAGGVSEVSRPLRGEAESGGTD